MIITTNALIQGSVNSPWLLSIFLEELLFANPALKEKCDDLTLLAFADDLFL